MKNTITLLILLFVCQITASQNYDFGKVSKEELEEKFNPLDSSANASYLYKYRKTYFDYQPSNGFQLITEIHERIKIYNQEGFDYATKSVPLYKSVSKEEHLSSLKAYTYNLTDGIIEETKLKKDGIFKTEMSKYFNEKKFTMPNVKEGCVLEYKYKVISPFYSNVDEFKFQHSIPVKKLEARFEAPEYFNFKVNIKGFLSFTPKISKKRGKIELKQRVRQTGYGINSGRGSIRSSNLEFSTNVSSYDLNDIPPLKDEPFVNNIDNYRSAVKYELSYTKFPNATLEHYSTSWEDVVKTIYKSPRFGTELNKSGYYEEDINNLITGVSDPKSKMDLIYDFVKSKVKWNTYYGKYTDKGVKKAYKEQVGNVAEINLMLTSMLRYAGLNANPVLVSTRQNGIPIFPTREGYNYVISCVEVPNDVILLDATSKYGTPNVLPFRTLNWQGRIIRKNGSSSLIDLYPKENSKSSVSMLVKILSDNGDIEGGCRSMRTLHKGLSYRSRFNATNEDDFLEKLENKYGGMEISSFKVTNATDLSKPVIESYKFAKEGQADVIGDKIYFSPLLFMATKENPFKLEERAFPIDFGHPSTSQYRVTISLPEGYKIESTPEPLALALPDNLGTFKYNIINYTDSIQLQLDTNINQSIIPSMYYDTLKEYFKQLIEKENEQVVLSKTKA